MDMTVLAEYIDPIDRVQKRTQFVEQSEKWYLINTQIPGHLCNDDIIN